MPIRVTLHDQTSTGRDTGSLELAAVPSALSLRDLIQARVREEVSRYDAGGDVVFSGLVAPEGSVRAKEGFALPTRRHVDWEKQADVAIEAFQHNEFFVIVGGRQVTDLDAQLHLSDGAEVRFVRLVQLVGG